MSASKFRSFAFLALGLASASALADPGYTVTTLDGLGIGYKLNNAGTVAGHGPGGSDSYNNVVSYSNGAYHDLGRVGWQTLCRGINESGQITGFAATDGGTTAFLYANGTMQDLGFFGGKYTQGVDVNSSGQVLVTTWSDSFVGTRNYLYSNGSSTYLGDTSSFGSTMGINDAGHIIGSNATNGFIYRNGTFQNLGGFYPTLLNESDQMAGISLVPVSPGAPSQRHAAVYQNGAMKDLGVMSSDLEASSEAKGINNLGYVVGAFTRPEASSSLGRVGGFVYKGDRMVDLTTLLAPNADGWRVTSAWDINDSGWILAGAVRSDGTGGVVLLKPVPEPASMLALSMGALAVLRRRKRA